MSIGFKEWALVCQALENGATSLIIRKGGIAEGREGFRFLHRDFFLFPTLFHEQLAKTRLPDSTSAAQFAEGAVVIAGRATVEWTMLVTDRQKLKLLEPFHILQPSVVEDRFVYDPKPGRTPERDGVNVAFLRVWKAGGAWTFPQEAKYGGCRSWVELPEPPEDIVWHPALTDLEHAERAERLRAILSSS